MTDRDIIYELIKALADGLASFNFDEWKTQAEIKKELFDRYETERKEREKERCDEYTRERKEEFDQLKKKLDEEGNGTSLEKYFASLPMGVYLAGEERCCCDD